MPTHILYEQIWTKPRNIKQDEGTVPSFFEAYNPYAIKGSLVEIRRPRQRASQNKATCEDDLLSRPYVWVRDVIEGISKDRKKGKELLAEICKFLYDASFYGIHSLRQGYSYRL